MTSRTSSQHGDGRADIFDDHGRLPEDDGGEEPEQEEWPWQNHDGWWGHSWSQGGWRDDDWRQWYPQSTYSQKYDVSEPASQAADKFLPDFVVAWMLLQRSGLDHTERGTIIANLRNRFTTDNVKSALKLAWPEDDLRKRDNLRGAALLMDEDDDDGGATPDDAAYDDGAMSYLAEDDQQEYAHVCSEVDHALQAFQVARRTLKDAREKQSQFRKSRQFFQGKPHQNPMKKDSSKTVTCFKCGGAHPTSSCTKTSQSSTGSAHLAFSVSGVDEPMAMASSTETCSEPAELGFSLHQIVHEGKAIIDGGATSSVGSVDALNRVLALQEANQFPCQVDVQVDDQPQFRFGNNGRTKCLSTTVLGVPLNEGSGSMKVHVHDIENQPVLLSVSALRSLKAVIDFEKDELVMKAVDPRRVIKLERTQSGHQLFPLASDIMLGSHCLGQAFESFAATCAARE